MEGGEAKKHTPIPYPRRQHRQAHGSNTHQIEGGKNKYNQRLLGGYKGKYQKGVERERCSDEQRIGRLLMT